MEPLENKKPTHSQITNEIEKLGLDKKPKTDVFIVPLVMSVILCVVLFVVTVAIITVDSSFGSPLLLSLIATFSNY